MSHDQGVHVTARSFRAAVATFLLLTFGLRGAAQNEPKPSYLDQVFTRGETLTYSVSWMSIFGGTATMKITPGDKRTKIESIADSSKGISRIYPIHNEIVTVVDSATFSTLRYHKILQDRKRTKDELTIINPSKGTAFRKGKEFSVPTPVYDPLSIIYYIRRLDLQPGRKFKFTVVADGKVYELEANILKRETIGERDSRMRTIVVEPKMLSGGVFQEEKHRLLIWFTDDDRRLPVQIKTIVKRGSIVATLRTAKVGGLKPFENGSVPQE